MERQSQPSCRQGPGGDVPIRRNDSQGAAYRSSTIIEMSKLLREYDFEYHFLFSHVLRFVEQPNAYDDHGYMVPNVIRRVLDVFLAFKIPGGGGLPGQLDKLCTDYPELDREQLAALERLAQGEPIRTTSTTCCRSRQ